jgi:uncharacterized OB-fold protein
VCPTDWLVADALAPSTDGPLAPLFAAAGRGRLAMPFCPACAEPLELEALVCAACGGGPPEWREVEPLGTVHSATTVHRAAAGLVHTAGPYHVLDVELASRHRLVMTTTAPTPAAPAIGGPVAVGFRTVAGVAVPAAVVGVPAPSSPAPATVLVAPDTEMSP